MTKSLLSSLSPKVILLGLTVFSGFALKAQWEDPATTIDSSYTDSATDYSGETWESPKVEDEKAPEYLPYVRISMPMDTVTELISYKGIVNFGNCEFCADDSLYARAKKFLLKRFGEKDAKALPKDAINKDLAPEKYFITIRKPLYIAPNKNNKSQVGWYSCKIELRFSEPKYKYIITNFVHYYVQTVDGKDKELYNYAEYYMNSKNKHKSDDLILRAIDTEVKSFLADLEKAMRDPKKLYIDEDEWE